MFLGLCLQGNGPQAMFCDLTENTRSMISRLIVIRQPIRSHLLYFGRVADRSFSLRSLAAMPGYYVHSVYTAAMMHGALPVPAGRFMHEAPYGGSLLIMSDASQEWGNYDVYHSDSNVAMGPFTQSYQLLGKVRDVYQGMPFAVPPVPHVHLQGPPPPRLH